MKTNNYDGDLATVTFFTEKCKEVCSKEQYEKILEFEKNCSKGTISKITKKIFQNGWYMENGESLHTEDLSIFTEDRRYIGMVTLVK